MWGNSTSIAGWLRARFSAPRACSEAVSCVADVCQSRARVWFCSSKPPAPAALALPARPIAPAPVSYTHLTLPTICSV
eukprot:14922091-Alexandrium_andersonii.AAC.1